MKFSFLFELEQTFFLTVGVMFRVLLRLQVEYSLSCNSVVNLLVELFCGTMELLVEMNGQLTE